MREAHNRGTQFNSQRSAFLHKSLDSLNSNHAAIPGRFAGERGYTAFASRAGTGGADTRQWRLVIPGNWDGTDAMAARQMSFHAFTSDGKEAGQAVFSLVPAFAHSGGRVFAREMRRSFAGVPFSDLRRIVIDRMIACGGWVVNDLEQDFGGRRTFVVLAQNAASSDGKYPEQAWAFYFTESDGRIYSLATNSPVEFSDRMASESARLLASFHPGTQVMSAGLSTR